MKQNRFHIIFSLVYVLSVVAPQTLRAETEAEARAELARIRAEARKQGKHKELGIPDEPAAPSGTATPAGASTAATDPTAALLPSEAYKTQFGVIKTFVSKFGCNNEETRKRMGNGDIVDELKNNVVHPAAKEYAKKLMEAAIAGKPAPEQLMDLATLKRQLNVANGTKAGKEKINDQVAAYLHNVFSKIYGEFYSADNKPLTAEAIKSKIGALSVENYTGSKVKAIHAESGMNTLLANYENAVKAYLRTNDSTKCEEVQAKLEGENKKLAAEKQEVIAKENAGKVDGAVTEASKLAEKANKDPSAHKADVDTQVAALKKLKDAPGVAGTDGAKKIQTQIDALEKGQKVAIDQAASKTAETDLARKLLADTEDPNEGTRKDFNGDELSGNPRDANPVLLKKPADFKHSDNESEDDYKRLAAEREKINTTLNDTNGQISRLNKKLAPVEAAIGKAVAEGDTATAEKLKADNAALFAERKTAMNEKAKLESLKAKGDALDTALRVAPTLEYQKDVMIAGEPLKTPEEIRATTELAGTLKNRQTEFNAAKKGHETARGLAEKAGGTDPALNEAARLALVKKSEAEAALAKAKEAKTTLAKTTDYLKKAEELKSQADTRFSEPKSKLSTFKPEVRVQDSEVLAALIADPEHGLNSPDSWFEEKMVDTTERDPANPGSFIQKKVVVAKQDASGNTIPEIKQKINAAGSKLVYDGYFKKVSDLPEAKKKEHKFDEFVYGIKTGKLKVKDAEGKWTSTTLGRGIDPEKIKPVIVDDEFSHYDISGLSPVERIRFMSEFNKWFELKGSIIPSTPNYFYSDND